MTAEHNELPGKTWMQLRQRTRIARVANSALIKTMGEEPELGADSPLVQLVCDDLAKVLAAMDEVLAEGSTGPVQKENQ